MQAEFREGKPQRLWTPEELRFAPSAVMRPHHFLNPIIQEALQGKREPDAIALEYATMLYLFTRNPGYCLDVYGEDQNEGVESFRKGLGDYFSRLRNLPDDSSILLDLGPDGICTACVIGKHCTGTNYISGFPARSIFDLEMESVNTIVEVLGKDGRKLGVDYIRKPIVHSLRDFGGRTLDEGGEVTVRENLVFNSLVAKTGALRLAYNHR